MWHYIAAVRCEIQNSKIIYFVASVYYKNQKWPASITSLSLLHIKCLSHLWKSQCGWFITSLLWARGLLLYIPWWRWHSASLIVELLNCFDWPFTRPQKHKTIIGISRSIHSHLLHSWFFLFSFHLAAFFCTYLLWFTWWHSLCFI